MLTAVKIMITNFLLIITSLKYLKIMNILQICIKNICRFSPVFFFLFFRKKVVKNWCRTNVIRCVSRLKGHSVCSALFKAEKKVIWPLWTIFHDLFFIQSESLKERQNAVLHQKHDCWPLKAQGFSTFVKSRNLWNVNDHFAEP